MLPRHLLPLAAAAVGISATTLVSVLDSQNATLNDAINGLLASEAFSAQLQADPGILTAILKYHIFNGTYYTSNFTGAAAPVFVRILMDNAIYSNVTFASERGQIGRFALGDSAGRGENSNRITERETDYQKRRFDRVLTPTRADPFAANRQSGCEFYSAWGQHHFMPQRVSKTVEMRALKTKQNLHGKAVFLQQPSVALQAHHPKRFPTPHYPGQKNTRLVQ
ncbi:hypothetical protein B0T24DRAFT_597944 [Lasiosphaeria ovina]|uniref:FAS1 domain-containing protein n=1 Tax=Lasiosphaeria ovina TaxID=92902 RepID=A0AAE0N0X9_9PEZI|nr:hypothetical protein B0T24DRAFT_597944 [Lasiosphaeria ovina]